MDDRRRDLFNKRLAQALWDLHGQLPAVAAELMLGEFDQDERDAFAEVLEVLAGRLRQGDTSIEDIGADGAR